MRQTTTLRRGIVTFLWIAASLSACALPGPKLDLDDAESPSPVAYTLHAIGSEPMGSISSVTGAIANPELDASIENYEYRVGRHDVLGFTIWDHPELTIPAGEFRGAEVQGHLVGVDGTVFFPYVGVVDVAGLTVPEIRERISQGLSHYIQNPQLDVRVVDFRSQRINVTGEVMIPRIVQITDMPKTLVEALSEAGGRTPTGSLSRVQVTRDGIVTSHDLEALFSRGDLSQNLLLRHGDIVYVPHTQLESVHVIGEVMRPGLAPMDRGRLNLAEALSAGGSFDLDKASVERVFVIRRDPLAPDRADVYWLDARSPVSMLLATRFQMQAQDVVFVSARELTRWNRLVLQILPTVQTIWQTQNMLRY